MARPKPKRGEPKTSYEKFRPTPLNVLQAIESDDIEALKKALTVRQLRFCEEYVIDFNASAAALRAGYATKWADRYASILLHNEGVRYYIDHLSKSKEAKIVSIDPDYIVKRVLDIVDKDDTRDGDKLRGLELLARHLGMLRDKTEISGPDGKALEIEQRTREEVSQVIAALQSMGRRERLKVVGGTDSSDGDE